MPKTPRRRSKSPLRAGLAVGFWSSTDDLCANWAADKTWEPEMDDGVRTKQLKSWEKAISKSLGWAGEDEP